VPTTSCRSVFGVGVVAGSAPCLYVYSLPCRASTMLWGCAQYAKLGLCANAEGECLPPILIAADKHMAEDAYRVVAVKGLHPEPSQVGYLYLAQKRCGGKSLWMQDAMMRLIGCLQERLPGGEDRDALYADWHIFSLMSPENQQCVMHQRPRGYVALRRVGAAVVLGAVELGDLPIVLFVDGEGPLLDALRAVLEWLTARRAALGLQPGIWVVKSNPERTHIEVCEC